MEQQEQRPVEVLNARIVNTSLGFDGPVLNSGIQLQARGLGVTFGGYVLHTVPQSQEQEDWQTAFGLEYITRVLNTVGVQRWEDLKGQSCRMAIQGNQILGIGNLIEEVWFYPRELGEQFMARSEKQAEALRLLRDFNAGKSDMEMAGGEDQPKEERGEAAEPGQRAEPLAAAAPERDY